MIKNMPMKAMPKTKDMMMDTMPTGKDKAEGKNEDKSKGKIKDISIHKMDDGTFTMRCTTDKGATQETSHMDAMDMMDQLHDNVMSPHLPKLGSGQRFSNLASSLQAKGSRNPDALATWIGKRKWGASRFTNLSAGGKE